MNWICGSSENTPSPTLGEQRLLGSFIADSSLPASIRGRDTKPEEDRIDTDKKQLWDYFAGVSAVLAGVASATYILGFLALFIPIAATRAPGLAAAWYATILASKNLVVVQGVNQLLLPP